MNEENKFEIEVLICLTKIETMLIDFKRIETKANESYNIGISNQKRLDDIEDNNKWLFKTCVGAFITASISLIVALIKML